MEDQKNYQCVKKTNRKNKTHQNGRSKSCGELEESKV